MIVLEIPGTPTPWSAPTFSRGRAYSKKSSLQSDIKLFIKSLYSGPIITEYTHLFFHFFFLIPKTTPVAKRNKMLLGDIIPTRSDCTNLQKFYEDCLKGIVIDDDRKVKYISSHKRYGTEAKTIIEILKV